MDRDRAILTVTVCLFMFLCLCFITVTNGDEERKQRTEPAPSFWPWQKLRSFYSLYSKVWSPSTWSWQLLKEAYSRFISPNLGFSKGGEKMKQASTKGGLGAEDNAAKSGCEKQHQNEL